MRKPASPASMRYLLHLSSEHPTPEGDTSTSLTISNVDEIVNHDGRKNGVRVTQPAVSHAIQTLLKG